MRSYKPLLLAAAVAFSLSSCAVPQDSSQGLEQELRNFSSEARTLLEESGSPRRTTADTDYDRDAFGSSWADVDNNSCDQRNDVLARDLTDLEFEDDCVVLGGVLDDPYTGDVITYEYGASQVDIDHIVPLSAAWKMGADAWTDAERETFANDFDNLRASYMGANRSKGDATPAEWMPENEAFQCEYVTQFITVVDKYDLKLAPADSAVQGEVC